jgi:two-component system sensor histidine kinase TctE
MAGPVIVFVLLLAIGSVCGIALRARRLERRRGSLTRPLHELRGAMSALGLGLALIEREPSLRRLGARFDALRAQLDRAGAAIDDLDRARGAGATNAAEQPRQPVDLASLVMRRARAWSQLAPAYGAQLRLSWRAGAVALLGDRLRLEQALDNLIANALEHGGRRVLVEGIRCGAVVRISIWDSGTGIGRAPEEVAEAPARSLRGHGLAIARAAIEWHGGQLSAIRRDGGAAVAIQLPTNVGATAEYRSLQPPDAGRQSRNGSTVARAA